MNEILHFILKYIVLQKKRQEGSSTHYLNSYHKHNNIRIHENLVNILFAKMLILCFH